MTGPLKGLKVLELAGIGPGPMAAMLLADMGATVLRIERKDPTSLGVPRPLKYDLLLRNRRSIPLDFKKKEDLELVKQLIARSDVLMEGFRPGVTEKLGLGPEICMQLNPALIYGRMTGWGQEGPLSNTVGHDINYIALTGALHAIGRKGQPPSVPINLIGDFGGGTLYLVMGILAALFELKTSGKGIGQVVDAAMVDGVASLMTQPQGSFGAGIINTERGTNVTDSGAPFYEVYECADGKFLSIGAVEHKFYKELLNILDLSVLFEKQWEREHWVSAKEQIAKKIKMRNLTEWEEIFKNTETCVAPVLSIAESPMHPHLKERGTYVEIEGVIQPSPAPRFSRTKNDLPKPHKAWSIEDAYEILGPWLSKAEIDKYKKLNLIS